jgi:hypothetical protein
MLAEHLLEIRGFAETCGGSLFSLNLLFTFGQIYIDIVEELLVTAIHTFVKRLISKLVHGSL